MMPKELRNICMLMQMMWTSKLFIFFADKIKEGNIQQIVECNKQTDSRDLYQLLKYRQECIDEGIVDVKKTHIKSY